MPRYTTVSQARNVRFMPVMFQSPGAYWAPPVRDRGVCQCGEGTGGGRGV